MQYFLEIYRKDVDHCDNEVRFYAASTLTDLLFKSVEDAHKAAALGGVQYYKIRKMDDEGWVAHTQVLFTSEEVLAFEAKEKKLRLQRQKEDKERIEKLNSLPEEYVLFEATAQDRALRVIGIRPLSEYVNNKAVVRVNLRLYYRTGPSLVALSLQGDNDDRNIWIEDFVKSDGKLLRKKWRARCASNSDFNSELCLKLQDALETIVAKKDEIEKQLRAI